MTKKEWQEYYEVSDEDMNKIDSLIKMFGGKICSISEIKVLTSIEKGSIL